MSLDCNEFDAGEPRQENSDNPRSTTPNDDQEFKLDKFLMKRSAILAMDLPPRECLIGDWFLEGSAGMVFGPRGIGKSRFTYALATALTTRQDLGPWKTHASVRCLIVDGEMPLADNKERFIESDNYFDTSGAPDEVLVINKIHVFDESRERLNLNQAIWRERLLSLAINHKIGAIVLDNLSTLSAGADENSASDCEGMEEFIMDARAHGIATILVHHTGKQGNTPRGSSKREDALEWIIRLDRGDDTEGASFAANFTKSRHCKTPEPVEFQFKQTDDGAAKLECKNKSAVLQLLDAVSAGLSVKGELAAQLDWHQKKLQRVVADAKQNGYVEVDHHTVKLTQEGENELSKS